jgi:hypothetical protein
MPDYFLGRHPNVLGRHPDPERSRMGKDPCISPLLVYIFLKNESWMEISTQLQVS